MTLLRRGSGWTGEAAHEIALETAHVAAHGFAATALLLALVVTSQIARAQTLTADAGWQNVTLDQYREHLAQLESVVADCAAQQKLKSPPPAKDNACDPGRVGPDDRVSTAVAGDSQPREVRYDWLRVLLARAGSKPGTTQQDPGRLIPGTKSTPPPAVDVLLGEAQARLENDEKQTAGPAAPEASYASERQTLTGILSQKAYKGVTEVSARERFLEWLDGVLDRFLQRLVRFGTRSPWIVWTLRALLLLGICVGLVWAFLRMDRGPRVKLIPDDFEPAPGAPSSREWQLWLKDAQAMAEKDQWRDAIHLLYWAAISRLESRRMWPADRTRTPREYLGMMPGSDPRTRSLTALTRSFERTWYGGRAAAADDFQSAMEQAATLGVKTE
jgi:Domain of unknown function (DUF4129)